MGGRGAKSGLSGKGGIGGAGGGTVSGGSAGGTVTNGRTGGVIGGGAGGGVVGTGGAGGGAGGQGQGPPGSGPVRERENIGGVDVTHYNEMYGFGDGTSGGIHKTGEADVYETPEGVRFIFPKDYDRRSQPITPSQILSAWNRLPDIMKALAARDIEILDYYNPQDVYWQRVYRNFSHSFATGGIGKISFYGCRMQVPTSQIVGTMCHETGHVIDQRLSRYSERQNWKEAMQADEAISGKKSPTKYGENANAEDFAESMKMYFTNASWFAREFPNRKRLIDSILSSF